MSSSTRVIGTVTPSELQVDYAASPLHSRRQRSAPSVLDSAADAASGRVGTTAGTLGFFPKLRPTGHGRSSPSFVMLPSTTLLLVLGVSFAATIAAEPFPSSAALKNAVDRCLAAVPSGESCCSTGAVDCGPAYGADMPDWDTSLVTSMEGLFKNKGSFNQNITAWNVSRVTSLRDTFSGAGAFNQDIGRWNVSHVTSLEATFSSASAFNQDIGRWDTSRVTSLSSTFSSTSAFNQNIGRWDVSRVTSMTYTFRSSGFNQDLANWNVRSVTAMFNMFDGARAFKQNITGWTLRQDRSVYVDGMFSGATAWLAAYTNCGYDDWDAALCTGAYTASGSLYNGPPSAWVRIACDVSVAPVNGALGNCTDSVSRGSTCTPTCNNGFTSTGSSSCNLLGRLTAATCSSSASMNCSCLQKYGFNF